MLKNYIKIALRNFRKKAVNSFVVVLGLVISLAFCVLMFLFVDGALRWDRDHPDADNTYLVSKDYFLEDDVDTDFSLFDFSEKSVSRYSTMSYVHSRDFQQKLPEFKESTLAYNLGLEWKSDVKFNGNVYKEAVAGADKNFFDFFAHEVITGNIEVTMNDPKSVVLTEDVVLRYFGKTDVLDQTFFVIFKEKPEEFKVGAVVRLPDKSSITFAILMNMESNRNIGKNIYELQSNSSFHLFVKLPAEVDQSELLIKTQAYFESTFPSFFENERNWSKVSPDSPLLELRLINIQDIHLDSLLHWDGKANIRHILLVGLFAVVLIVVSGINYLLITMATLSSRISEISLRRISGARRIHVLTQFWIENFLVIIFSHFLAICLLQFSIPFIEEKTGVTIYSSLPYLLRAGGTFALLLFAVSWIVSLYPAQVISRVSLPETLKGNRSSKLNTRFVNWLVVVQFTLCFGFIIAGLVMNKQMNYVMNKDMGFDKEQVVLVKTGSKEFNRALKTHTEFSAVARGGGWMFGHGTMMFINKINNEDIELVQFDAEPELIDLLGLKIDWLDSDYGKEHVAIVNGKAADLIGSDQLSKTKVGMRQRVVGVIENTTFIPFTSPTGYFYISPNTKEERRLRQTFVKIQAGQLKEGLQRLEEVWDQVFPNNYFEYVFVDDYIAENYESHAIATNLINFITLLGLVISCLGLFALNGIIAQNKLKEIGIRKVLGAGIKHIMMLLNRRVILIIGASGLIAIPISYRIISAWLGNFSEHITLSWQYFAVAILIGLSVSIVVVLIQTIKAATVDPVKLIKEQ